MHSGVINIIARCIQKITTHRGEKTNTTFLTQIEEFLNVCVRNRKIIIMVNNDFKRSLVNFQIKVKTTTSTAAIRENLIESIKCVTVDRFFRTI